VTGDRGEQDGRREQDDRGEQDDRPAQGDQPAQCEPRERDDRGSASIWLLGLAALVLSVTLVVLAQAAATLGRHRLQRSSDVAALAAAGRIGRAGDPCQAAARIARANGAVLEGCSATLDPDGRGGTVAVRLSARVEVILLGSRVAHARSRAGRLPVAAGPP
jgi:secretion/DNA translocation related TadE-like protein